MAITFRRASRDDLVTIIRMLADDPLGSRREQFETPLPESYYAAFEAIDRDPNNELIVACVANEVVGIMQITFIPYLTYKRGWRALVEGVRVESRHRNHGIGKSMFQWAVNRARERG